MRLILGVALAGLTASLTGAETKPPAPQSGVKMVLCGAGGSPLNRVSLHTGARRFADDFPEAVEGALHPYRLK